MDDNVADSPLETQLAGCPRIDHYVLDVGQGRRERIAKVVVYTIDYEPVPFPAEVMMVGHAWHPRFSKKLGNGHPERDVHGDSQCVFGYEYVQIELTAEFIEVLLKVILDSLDLMTYFGSPACSAENLMMNVQNLRMIEVS